MEVFPERDGNIHLARQQPAEPCRVRMEVFPERDGNKGISLLRLALFLQVRMEVFPERDGNGRLGNRMERKCHRLVRMEVFPERDGNEGRIIGSSLPLSICPNGGLP